MDPNQVHVHVADNLLVPIDNLHSDSIRNQFLSDDYMVHDDLDGSGMYLQKYYLDNSNIEFIIIITILITDNSTDSCNDEPSKRAPLREQDRFLPIANIAKIMKRAIPDNGKVRVILV